MKNIFTIVFLLLSALFANAQDTIPCKKMFYCLEKYAKKYNIPFRIAFGIANTETKYNGINHTVYDHKLASKHGALGPMQIKYTTAQYVFPEKKFTRYHLKTDIDFNVECSMKLMRKLYDRHKNWKLAVGAYNTGKPIINKYVKAVYKYNRNHEIN